MNLKYKVKQECCSIASNNISEICPLKHCPHYLTEVRQIVMEGSAPTTSNVCGWFVQTQGHQCFGQIW